MIPSGYKEDVVYSQIPTDGSGDLSFTRASNGTRVNSAGLVEVCPWNLLQQSEALDNAAWTSINTTETIGATAPDGTATAWTLSKSAASGRLYQVPSVISGTVTFSVYAKAGTTNEVSLETGNSFRTLNLSTGTLVSGGVGDYNIESVGNGWYRFSIVDSAYSGVAIYVSPTANTSGNILVWHPQYNIGSTAKPYFPTTDRLNVPRLTYQNGGGGCPSLLLEKQSTNLLSYSEQFDDAVWSKNSASITANTTTSPDGTTNADTLTLTALSGHIAQLLTKSASAITYTLSCYIKAGTSSLARISMSDYLTGQADGIINLSTQTITASNGTWSSASASINNMGNGWYYCRLTATSPINGFVFTKIQNDGANSTTIQIWGAQLEASSYPTSYIPTTSASATRVADACSKTGISSLIGQTSGSVFADFVYLGGVQAIPIELSNAASNNIINVYITSSATTQSYMFNGGSQVGFINSSHTFVQGSRYKMAIGYASNDLVLYINGAQIGSATPSSIPTLSEVYISRDKAASYLTETKYNEMVIFPTRLTNAELATLTTI
jgi:hypothetical protein